MKLCTPGDVPLEPYVAQPDVGLLGTNGPVRSGFGIREASGCWAIPSLRQRVIGFIIATANIGLMNCSSGNAASSTDSILLAVLHRAVALRALASVGWRFHGDFTGAKADSLFPDLYRTAFEKNAPVSHRAPKPILPTR